MGKTAAKLAVVYCRTSTGAQKEAETIGAQIERCHRIIQRHGVRVFRYGPTRKVRAQATPRSQIVVPAGWVVDDGVSGSLLKGREFAKLIDDLEARRVKVDYLIVFSLSRIARPDKSSSDMGRLVQSATDVARIKAVLHGAGVMVIDEDGINDPASFSFEIKMLLSGEQYKLIRASTMAGKARWLGEGRFARGGRPPFGYKQVPINGIDAKAGYMLVEHPENGKRVRKILGWFVEGGYAYAARKANEAGWEPSSATTNRKKKAKGWADSVRYIVLHARTYLGEQTIEFAGETHVVKFPALIDSSTYARIVRAQKELTIAGRAEFLTTGLVDCECGKHLMQHASRGRHWARCRGNCGSTRGIEFSSALWFATLARLLRIKEAGGDGDDKDESEAQLRAARCQVKEAEERIGRLFDAYQEGELPKPVWKERNEPLRDALLAAQADVDRFTRARDSHALKRATAQTVEARVGTVFDELVMGDPPLARRRQLLGDILNGERAIVSWPKKGSSWATITLPAFRGLPAVTFTNGKLPMNLIGAKSARAVFDAFRAALGKSMTNEIRLQIVRGTLHAARALGEPRALEALDTIRSEGWTSWTDEIVGDLLDAFEKNVPQMRCGYVIAHVRALIPRVDEPLAAEYRELVKQLEDRGGLTPHEFGELVEAISEKLGTLDRTG
jgi:DNA invertase Pin-like site-specific DNA recombinase